MTDLGGVSDTGVGLGLSGGMDRPGGNGGAGNSSSEQQQYLVLGNPFQDPELLESMSRQWQQLPNWKQSKDWPGKGRRKRAPRNTPNLLVSVLTNMYFTTGQVNFFVTDPCISLLDQYVLTASHASR